MLLKMMKLIKIYLSNMNKQSKQRLIQAAKEYAAERWPSVPDHARAVPSYTDNSANSLTRCVIDWITLNGYQAERISNTGRYVDNRKKVTDVLGNTREIGSGKWIKGQGTAGTADISATIRGRSVKIEIKYGKDRQSEAQKKYQESIERAGGIYIIVKDFDSFLDWYDGFILKY